jgi:hypothetical protein
MELKARFGIDFDTINSIQEHINRLIIHPDFTIDIN